MGVYYIAKPTLKLIRTNEGTLIADESTDTTAFFSQLETVILLLSDGTNSLEDISRKIGKLYSVDPSRVLLDLQQFYKHRGEYFLKLGAPLETPVSLVENPNEFKFIPEEKEILELFSIKQLGIILSEKCPLKCKYCYAFSKRSKENIGFDFIDYNLVKRFVKEGSELGAYKLLIGGGDPLKYPFLVQLIKFSLEQGFKRIYISTKPVQKYPKRYFDELFKAGLRELQISIDSVTPSLLHKIVGISNYFENVFHTLYSAIASGLKVIVKTVLIKDNASPSEIQKLLNVLTDSGVEEININTAAPIGMASLDMLPTMEDETKVERIVKEFQKSHPEVKVTFAPSPFNKLKELNSPIMCTAFITNVFLYPDGSIEGCDFLTAFRKKFNLSLGNLKEKSLRDIWFNSPKAHLFRKIPQKEYCLRCPNRQMCFNGCKAFSIAFFGDINEPFNYCKPVIKKVTENINYYDEGR